ncbi:MAG: energy-coupling factor transporter transmembrane protein EcfT [Chloroflexi bacterium]|nr:energy-coupling factor transporter transmembrane protein EcfT [Chloroflexota bacterium]
MINQLYLSKNSVIHRLNFWVKFVCFLMIYPAIVLFSRDAILPLAMILAFSFVLMSRIPLSVFWRQIRLYLLVYCVIFLLVAIVFAPGTIEGRLYQGFVFAVKMFNITVIGLLFTYVTDPIEFPTGLLMVRLPHKYGIALMVSYRMIPLVAQRLTNVMWAQKARGAEFSLSLTKIHLNLRALFSLLIPFISSSLEASVALTDTLISRGYSPDRRITLPPWRLTLNDGAVTSFFIVVLFFALQY